jgi:hypothetical protein
MLGFEEGHPTPFQQSLHPCSLEDIGLWGNVGLAGTEEDGTSRMRVQRDFSFDSCFACHV